MITPLYLIRKQLGIAQLDICDRAQIDQGFLSRLERGKVRCSPETAARIVKLFKGHLTEEHLLYPERFEGNYTPPALSSVAMVPEGWQLVRKKLAAEQIKAVRKAAEKNLTVGNLWNAFLKEAPEYKE